MTVGAVFLASSEPGVPEHARC